MVLEFWLNHFTGLDFVQVRKGVFMKESWTSLGFEPCTFIYPGKYSTIKIMRPLVLKTCGHSPLFTTTITRSIVVLGWCIFKACKLVCAPKYTTDGITSLLVNWQLFNHTSLVAIHSALLSRWVSRWVLNWRILDICHGRHRYCPWRKKFMLFFLSLNQVCCSICCFVGKPVLLRFTSFLHGAQNFVRWEKWQISYMNWCSFEACK